MKYKGLVLDSRWNFQPHFARLASKAMAAANLLARLLPNLVEEHAAYTQGWCRA